MSNETTVGQIVGYLRMDTSAWNEEIDRADAKADELGRKDPKIRISTNAASVVAQLDAVAMAERRMSDASDRVRLAEMRLDEVRGRENATASAHLSAMQALTKARRAEQDAIFATYDANLKAGKSEDEVGNAARRATKDVEGFGKSFQGMGGGGMMSPQVIIGGIVGALALAGPVTGAATAGMAGFTAAAGVAYLAFRDFQKEEQQGTALGQELQSEVSGIKSEFDALGSTAAHAMEGDVLTGLSTIRRFLPSLNSDVESLGGHLGRAFSTSATGIVSGLRVMEPLLVDGGKYAEVLANKFADFAQSQEFKDFVEYARKELPDVGQALLDLGVGVKDLAVSFAPVGSDLVTIIDLAGKGASVISKLVDVANKVPTTGLFWINKASDLLKHFRGDASAATKAVDDHTSAIASLQNVQSPLATALGMTNAQLKTSTDLSAAAATKAANLTANMQLEGDAAGLLKQQLDILNGKTLDVAEAQTASASATLAVTKALKENGSSLSLNTEKGIADRQAIEAKIQADQRQAEAIAKSTGSTKAGTTALADSKAQLEKTLRSQGLLTAGVQAYIDKLYAVPKKVPPTVLEVKTAAALAGIAAFQKAINSLHGANLDVTTHYAYTGTLPSGGRSTAGGSTFAGGGEIPGYAGGTLIGPGSGTSDSILAMVAQTQQLVRLSTGEFVSTSASRSRNRAALEAGNRGATLAVAGTGGAVRLDDVSILKLAAAMSGVTLRPTISAASFDRAMGGQR